LETGNFSIALNAEELDAGLFGVRISVDEEHGIVPRSPVLTIEEAHALRTLLEMAIDAAEDAADADHVVRATERYAAPITGND
jgi:uncharacterized protein YaiL (DUF2058 family)